MDPSFSHVPPVADADVIMDENDRDSKPFEGTQEKGCTFRRIIYFAVLGCCFFSVSFLLLYFLKEPLHNFFISIAELGFRGVVYYILIEWIALVCLVPASPFEFGAGLAFGSRGLLYASVVSVVGKLGGASINFLLGRYCYRKKAYALLERGGIREEVLTYAFSGEEKHWTMLAVQVSIFPYAVKTYGLGLVENISFPYYFIFTTVVAIPYSIAFAHAGDTARKLALSTEKASTEETVMNICFLAIGLLATAGFIIRITAKTKSMLSRFDKEIKARESKENVQEV
eukprot:g1844.t1